MAVIERDNPALKDVLPRDYARPALDKRRLGRLIDPISNIRVGNEDDRSRDGPQIFFGPIVAEPAGSMSPRGRMKRVC